MAGKRSQRPVDNVQLNALSSAVLFDSVGKKRKTGPYYDAERIIQRRKRRHVSF